MSNLGTHQGNATGRFPWQLLHQDEHSAARRGTLCTPHGNVETPAFMPVGTQGTVKGLTVEQLAATGSQMILANTYHLALRPGAETVAALGGLHRFAAWPGPILTDSGGFQLFSLAQRTQVTEAGAVFRSHIDGSLLELSPERAVEIQQMLGSDIAMVLDHVVALPNTDAVVREAMERSIRWARRCQTVDRSDSQALFAIVQGGLRADWRQECASRLAELNFPGYAIGGLSVGEPPAEMYRILEATCPHLPEDRPRYLMGVGKPIDLLEGVLRGVDLFDCVMPSRNGRNALAFTFEGVLRLRNSRHIRDDQPLESGCHCPACHHHSRGYLHHLFRSQEMLGPILLTAHNLHFYQRLMSLSRAAISAGNFTQFVQNCRQRWSVSVDSSRPDE